MVCPGVKATGNCWIQHQHGWRGLGWKNVEFLQDDLSHSEMDRACSLLLFWSPTHGFSIRVAASFLGKKTLKFLDFQLLLGEYCSLLLGPKQESLVMAKMTKHPHIKCGNSSQMQLWDGAVHVAEMVDETHVSRCHISSCKSKTYVMSTKCKVFHCVSKKGTCFLKYHIN